MNNYPCSYDIWARYVMAQHPSNLAPAEWIAPRRLEEQRRGIKFAMTFGELQRMLADNAAGGAFDVASLSRPPPRGTEEDLFPERFESEQEATV